MLPSSPTSWTKPASPGGDARPEPCSLPHRGGRKTGHCPPPFPLGPGNAPPPTAATGLRLPPSIPSGKPGSRLPSASARPGTDPPRRAGLGPAEAGPRRASHASGSPRPPPQSRPPRGRVGPAAGSPTSPRRRAGRPTGPEERRDAPVTCCQAGAGGGFTSFVPQTSKWRHGAGPALPHPSTPRPPARLPIGLARTAAR